MIEAHCYIYIVCRLCCEQERYHCLNCACRASNFHETDVSVFFELFSSYVRMYLLRCLFIYNNHMCCVYIYNQQEAGTLVPKIQLHNQHFPVYL